MLLNYSSQYDPQGATKNYLQDSLNPTFTQTVENGFMSSFESPQTAISDLYSEATGKPLDEQQKQLQANTEAFNNIASKGSTAASFIGNGLGMLANPLSLGLSLITGGAAGLVGKGILDYAAPEMAQLALGPSLKAGEALVGSVQGASIGAATSLAPSISDNYNTELNKVNWAGVAKATAINGALGFALGSIPMAYGLLKYRVLNKLPVSKMEKEFADKNLADHISKNQESNSEIADISEDIINKYVANPKMSVDQGTVNFEVANELDLDNVQSVMADSISSSGSIDSETLKSLLTPSLTPLLSEGQLTGALEQAKIHLQLVNDGVEKTVSEILAKRHKKLVPTIAKIMDLPEEQLKNLENSPADSFLKTLFRQKRFKNKTISQTVLEHIEASPENYGKRTVQQASELRMLSDLHDRIVHHNNTLTALDTLIKASDSLPPENESLKKLTNYNNSRLSESSPLPKIPAEEENTTQTQQKIERQNVLNSNESIEPEDLNRFAKGMAEPIQDAQKALESIKNNNKVFSKLINCVVGK